MFKFLRPFAGRRLTGSASRRPLLRIERLEDRAVPSAAELGPPLPGHSAAARGLASGVEEVIDLNHDGVPDAIYVGSMSYNAKGELLHERASGDWDHDGVVDYTVTVDNMWDNPGRLTSQTSVVDYTSPDQPDSRN